MDLLEFLSCESQALEHPYFAELPVEMRTPVPVKADKTQVGVAHVFAAEHPSHDAIGRGDRGDLWDTRTPSNRHHLSKVRS